MKIFLGGIGNACPYIIGNLLVILPVKLPFMGFADMIFFEAHNRLKELGVPALRRERPLFTTQPA